MQEYAKHEPHNRERLPHFWAQLCVRDVLAADSKVKKMASPQKAKRQKIDERRALILK